MSDDQELIQLTQRLLQSIVTADWKTYAELCDETLTCFEPEARGQLVVGLPFHKYYFDRGASSAPINTTMCSPHVRMLGSDAAVVSYTRLTQRLDAAGRADTTEFQETRIWQKRGGQWRHVHFHRSHS